MEVPRLGVAAGLHHSHNTNHVCDLHQSLWQNQILNLLSEARGQTWVLKDTLSGS